jgi:uncharacterized protein YndB with AHSA1/START domain
MLKKIGIFILALIAVILLYAATKPDSFRVERSIDIKAPPEKIFAILDNFKGWIAWSPFEKDPTMKRTFSGPENGVGSIYEWDGEQIGKGRMETIESDPPTKMVVTLHFIEPMEGHNIADFTLQQNDAGSTTVTWAMYGPSPYISKLMSIFFSFDSMIGDHFSAGLSDLKKLAEK